MRRPAALARHLAGIAVPAVLLLARSSSLPVAIAEAIAVFLATFMLTHELAHGALGLSRRHHHHRPKRTMRELRATALASAAGLGGERLARRAVTT